MKRGKPLARSKPLRRGRLRRKPTRVKAGADPAYLEAVRRLPCAVSNPLCQGAIHAHHAGRRPGVGLKAPDDTAIPLCARHHMAWHDMTGWFGLMDKEQRRLWSDERIIETRAKVSIARSAA